MKSRSQNEQNELHDIEAGEQVIVFAPNSGVIACRTHVDRRTTTGLIVVEGRHYDPTDGRAITRGGWLEPYSEERWREACAAAQSALEGDYERWM